MIRKVVFACVGASALAFLAVTAGAATSETYRQLDLFGDVFERVRAEYVEEVTDAQLIESAIEGMLNALDPHSSYMNPQSFKDMQVQTKGEFGGLGIEVTMDDGLVKVVSPIDDTPAFRAGLQPGDFISHVDGEQVLGLTLNEAVERMRGPINSSIVVTVRRKGIDAPFDVSMTRDIIRIQSVRMRAEGNVAYVRITSFNEQTEKGLLDGMKALDAELGEKLQGVVLDLRNNPGGLLDQAVAVSDAFLEQGEIVSTRGRRPDSAQRSTATPGDIAHGLPMVVLINGGSASASEIVAGALQDHHRAIVLGTRSFGKATVQTVIPLSGEGAIRLTTARYFTPSGRSIQAKGIEPDIAVEQATIQAAATSDFPREEQLRGRLEGDQGKTEGAPSSKPAPAPAAPPAAPAETPGSAAEPAPDGEVQAAPATADTDYQLQRALDLIKGVSLFDNKA